MLFNSLHFLIFFPLCTALYFLCPYRWRWGLLLAASCIFYMAFIPAYILILAGTIVIDYFAAIGIENSRGVRKKVILTISIVATCLILFIFKYFNFFNSNLRAAADLLHFNYSMETLRLILPIGLSFHTFQSLSYVIEVYRGRQRTERHFGIYALYVMFYPQLVAGPIERPQNLLHQFYEKHDFEYERVTDGLKLMAWGLFKKVVIADRLALFTTEVYANPMHYSGVSLLMATVFFAYQIYCDFSGYSDIAIGSAQVMGFKLMDNFNQPYASKSTAEFWRRWHISLSTWFRDYVYIPLGGNRVPRLRRYLNLFLTFVLSGLWHGANWTFVVWGALNGFYLIFGELTEKSRRKISGSITEPLKVPVTFALICFSWIFFRANSIQDAFYIGAHLTDGLGDFFKNIFLNLGDLNSGKGILKPLFLNQKASEFGIAVAAILFMEGVHHIQSHGSIRHFLSRKPLWARWTVYYGLMIGLLLFGVFNQTEFIYFKF